MNKSTVWLFSGANSKFPSAVFESKDQAQRWIEQHALTGTLTEYPVGESVYDWALNAGYFAPTRQEQREAQFIANFSSASQAHVHYEDGVA